MYVPPNPGLIGRAWGLFHKADPYASAFAMPDATTILLKAGTRIALPSGIVKSFVAAGEIELPALTAGTDYAIYLCADGSLVADANFSAPTGWDASEVRRIGGFHHAPGGNAPAQAGGDTTPAINHYSLWDEKFRPACADPRGMTLVANSFWDDIYFLGVDHHVNGTSRNGVTIADGSAPPKVPVMFGGNGSTAYSNMTWWVAAEVLASHGKRLPTYAEACAASYGSTENVSRGNDPVTTGLGTTNAGSTNADQKFTSKWGVIQSTGCLYIWVDEFAQLINGADYAAATAFGWKNVNGGRGQVYTQGASISLSAALFGGIWGFGAFSGSRASNWNFSPADSNGSLGARGRCDHLCLV